MIIRQNNRLEYDIRRGDDRDKAALDLELITHTIQTNFENNKSNKIHIKSGIIGRYQKNYPNPRDWNSQINTRLY